jgi:transglutaminase-like putative cysteine protease
VASRPAERRRFGPEQGWLALVLLVLLAFLVGWAIDDARWFPGPENQTDFLPWAAIGGVLAGFGTAMLGWGRLRAHLTGAIAACLVTPILVGSVLEPREGDFMALYRIASNGVGDAFADLIIFGRGSTDQWAHSLLILGLLLWATGQFASYSVFGHGRAMPAVASLGTAMIVNVGLTRQEQLGLLVLFTAAALLLLVRMHAVDEKADWVRRRIGDPSPLTALTLRAGTLFVVVAVLAATALSASAHSAPLQSFWTDAGLQNHMIGVGRELQRWFPFLTSPKGPAIVDFSSGASIGLQWTSDPGIALTIERPEGDPTAYYWRAATYDRFEGTAWPIDRSQTLGREPGAPLLEGTLEGTTMTGRRPVTVTVARGLYPGRIVLGPGAPRTIDIPSVVELDPAGSVAALTAGGVASYEITGSWPITDEDDEAAFTANKLRAAGDDYLAHLTPDQLSRYLQFPLEAVGPESRALLEDVLAQAGPGATPYDIAATFERTLRDTRQFEYDDDIRDVDCGNLSTVECLATYKRGFCEYYATSMAVLMRAAGIPTRYVRGFLPGERSGTLETVLNSSAHAWVEVWFPGYGWYPFDPTPTLAQLAPLPLGDPVAPSPSPILRTDQPDPTRPIPSIPGGSEVPAPPGGPVGSGPFIAIALLLAIAVGGIAFASWRRGPRETTVDGAWSSVTTLARRLGFGPRPTQTVYEYSDSLGDVVPGVRPELQTVARAKVETAYGARILSSDRIQAVRAATSRLRLGLLPLAFRRRSRRR